MSDDQPYEVGSRRRRRELREAEERALAAQRRTEGISEQEPAPSDQPTSAHESARSPQEHRASVAKEPELFDQEARPSSSGLGSGGSSLRGSTPDSLESTAGSSNKAVNPVPAAVPVSARVTPTSPFDEVVAPQHLEVGLDEHQAESVHSFFPSEKEEQLQHIEHDEDGAPLLITSSSFGRGYQTVTPIDSEANRSVLLKRRKRRRRRNITLSVAAASFLVLLFGSVWLVNVLLTDTPPEDYDQLAGDTLNFAVEEGEVPSTVFERLVSDEVVASREALNSAWQNWEADGGDLLLQTGDFELREQMPAADAIESIFGGQEARLYVELARGTRLEQAFGAMSNYTRDFSDIDEQELRQAAEDPSEYGLPEDAPSLEGFLHPGEYYFPMDATANEILQAMVDETFSVLEDLGITDLEEQYETVTIASLLTAEGNPAQPDDYAVISGAIQNRLDENNSETNGFLQIDAAVTYGLNRHTLHFSEAERQDTDNQYNTYMHEGLPPGPIGAPGTVELEAAVNPDDNGYYYWVTVNIETGETRFASTYAEHQGYVAEFLQYCEDNPDECVEGEVENAESEVE